MPVNAVWHKIDARQVVPSLELAIEKLDSTEGEMVVDFSSVRRIDASAVKELEKLSGVADAKTVQVVLCGVNVDIYKVLKLTKLTGRFSFLT